MTLFKVKTYETRAMAPTTTYPTGWTGEMPQKYSTGKTWGLFRWGNGEFGSWFGVNLPDLYILPARIWDRPFIQEGYYGIIHEHS